METLVVILMVIAVGSFTAEVVGVPARINLVALGLLAWALATLAPLL